MESDKQLRPAQKNHQYIILTVFEKIASIFIFKLTCMLQLIQLPQRIRPYFIVGGIMMHPRAGRNLMLETSAIMEVHELRFAYHSPPKDESPVLERQGENKAGAGS